MAFLRVSCTPDRGSSARPHARGVYNLAKRCYPAPGSPVSVWSTYELRVCIVIRRVSLARPSSQALVLTSAQSEDARKRKRHRTRSAAQDSPGCLKQAEPRLHTATASRRARKASQRRRGWMRAGPGREAGGPCCIPLLTVYHCASSVFEERERDRIEKCSRSCSISAGSRRAWRQDQETTFRSSQTTSTIYNTYSLSQCQYCQPGAFLLIFCLLWLLSCPSFFSPLAIMADAPVDVLLKGSSGRNIRGLLRIIILVTIAAAAVSSRLFSVIRMSPFLQKWI